MNLKTTEDSYLVAGKMVDGKPDSTQSEQFPFKIDAVLFKRDATISWAGDDPHIEVAGRLLTSQSPLSSGVIAKRAAELRIAAQDKK